MFKEFIIKKIFGYIGKKLDGYKTKIGGIGFILLGLPYFIGFFFPDIEGMPAPDYEKGSGLVITGIVALGIGGKAEKIIKAIKQ